MIKSRFLLNYNRDGILELVKEALSSGTKVVLVSGFIKVTHTFGKIVGIDQAGRYAKDITIWIRPNGQVSTACPGI